MITLSFKECEVYSSRIFSQRQFDNVTIDLTLRRPFPSLDPPMDAPPPFKAATLHDVARHAGVSLITASRALSNPALVAERTIAKVQAAVQATGYIPNLMAG